ncbi:hypothetical protein MU582_12910 [Nocardioidaceae bacterium SCSIO 66511]|nr:hypothetical protein MU582_12910 [Nocardioidaceae bacterium SCSIO 66511]
MTADFAYAGRRAADHRPVPSWASAVVVTLLVFVVLGALAGWVWSALAQPAEYAAYRGPDGLIAYYSSEAEFGHDFEVDLVYAGIGALAALLGGLVTGWRYWGLGWPVTALAGAVALLTACLAWWLGTQFGPASLDESLAGARAGDTFTGPVELGARSIVLIWPIAALIGVMVSVWLRAPRDELFYGATEVTSSPAEPTA